MVIKVLGLREGGGWGDKYLILSLLLPPNVVSRLLVYLIKPAGLVFIINLLGSFISKIKKIFVFPPQSYNKKRNKSKGKVGI